MNLGEWKRSKEGDYRKRVIVLQFNGQPIKLIISDCRDVGHANIDIFKRVIILCHLPGAPDDDILNLSRSFHVVSYAHNFSWKDLFSRLRLGLMYSLDINFREVYDKMGASRAEALPLYSYASVEPVGHVLKVD